MPIEVEIVRIAMQAYGHGDIELAMELCDPLIRWDERSVRPDGELIWGRDEVYKAMRIYQKDEFDDYALELEKIKEFAPGRVVGLYTEKGTTFEGMKVDRRLGGLWVVESQLIVSWNAYLTPKEAVRAARSLSDGRFSEMPEAKRSRAAAAKQAASADGDEASAEAKAARAKRRAALQRRAAAKSRELDGDGSGGEAQTDPPGDPESFSEIAD